MKKTLFLLVALQTVILPAVSWHAYAEDVIKADEPKADAVQAEDSASVAVRETSPMLEGVDIPTADILDPKTFSTSFRFYSQGGITSRLVLGPFRRLNVGFSLDSQRLIGGEDPHLVKPAVFFKLKAFDGTDYLPALSLGYDNQGYLYKDSLRDFSQQERGLYVVGSHEIFIPDFEMHAGVNFPRIDESGNPYGFFGPDPGRPQHRPLQHDDDTERTVLDKLLLPPGLGQHDLLPLRKSLRQRQSRLRHRSLRSGELHRG
jgi:hypothetical protein